MVGFSNTDTQLQVITGVFCQTAIDSAQNDHATVIHSILANKQAHLEKVGTLICFLHCACGLLNISKIACKHL